MSFQTDVNGVRDTVCGLSGADPADAYMARVTDELVIEGNGYSITGGSRWITPDGLSNVIGLCPADKDVQATIVSNPVGLVALEDNVKVTVNDLQLHGLRAIAALRADTDLTLNRVTAQRTIDFYRFCDTGAIFLVSGENQNVTINDSVFEEAWNDGLVVQGRPDGNQFWGNAFIAGFSSAGTLSISNSWFGNFAGIPVIDWDGAVNIQTTEFKDTGFMNIRGGTATIVNSLIMGDAAGQGLHQRIMASDGGSITLEASTVAVSLLDCQTVCQSTTGPGLIIATNNASIELKASAISVGIPDIPDVLIREATGGNVTATAAPNPNWVQPVTPQDAAALKAILDQPALLTDAPGLPNKFAAAFFYEAATPLADDGGGTPGLLIDAVTGADSGNELLSPIDGVSPITEDIFGNPRTEAAGTVRNIGAVQLGLAPTLHLTATGDALVDLNWTRPTDPGSGAITSYEVCFGTGTVPDPSALGSDCEDGGGNPGTVQTISNAPDNLTGQVTALVNGETYWFLLRGANAVGGGPWSNPVIGTSYGVIGTPSLTVTSTSCSAVLLEWTQPDLGGHTFAGYTVSWGLGGSGTATGTIFIPDYNTLSTTISGLNCNTNYSFAVTASTVDGSAGSSGTGTVLTPPASPVPALGMRGSILLALVMLGISMAGVRRFHCLKVEGP
ncbi:fibronectin type III domain-containing protein [Halioglobus maricola]|uniref:fibronectin type III domain-containing protein n=1 Tax=Halioglobus maricola TaxID=2601894 RepID=UPI001478147D|nr:fibronectin type III domain-containing protein [Halioglobus maricola]